VRRSAERGHWAIRIVFFGRRRTSFASAVSVPRLALEQLFALFGKALPQSRDHFVYDW
jgi:hypothetical protein